MGLLVPWAKYTTELRNIRDERKRPQAAESAKPGLLFGLRHPSSLLNFSRTPRAVHDQNQSLLFRLPPEVRETIWTYAVGNHELTIVRKMTKLGHAVLPRDKERLDVAEDAQTHGRWITLYGSERRYKTKEVLAEESLLPLLMTSKRVHLEALPVLYEHNSFDFRTVEGLHRFVRRSPSVGIQSVSQLKITWHGFYFWPRYAEYGEREDPLEHEQSWDDLCNAITAMGGLRELRIEGWRKASRADRMYEPPDFDDYDTLVRILTPLRGLSDRVSFQFIIRGRALFAEQYQERLREGGHAHVQLVRAGRSEAGSPYDSE